MFDEICRNCGYRNTLDCRLTFCHSKMDEETSTLTAFFTCKPSLEYINVEISLENENEVVEDN